MGSLIMCHGNYYTSSSVVFLKIILAINNLIKMRNKIINIIIINYPIYYNYYIILFIIIYYYYFFFIHVLSKIPCSFLPGLLVSIIL